ncbi:unnamed protein product [Coffea canephora]|uniref:Uncharacterized protein n=1 Tax=Coffea canephora TaxID=49390 RepID=A0A068U7N4_COFCA|nr:unnamed protein product [Coffea canephora]
MGGRRTRNGQLVVLECKPCSWILGNDPAEQECFSLEEQEPTFHHPIGQPARLFSFRPASFRSSTLMSTNLASSPGPNNKSVLASNPMLVVRKRTSMQQPEWEAEAASVVRRRFFSRRNGLTSLAGFIPRTEH